MEQINALDGRITAVHNELSGTIQGLEAIDTTIANRVTIMENWNVPIGLAGLHSRTEALESAGRIASNWQDLLKEEVKKAIADKPSHKDGFLKGILESKAIWGIKPVDEAKHYRAWNKKFKNAIDQAKPGARDAIIFLETIPDKEVFDGMVDATPLEIILDIYDKKGNEKLEGGGTFLKELNRDLWAVLQDKAEGEALEKINAVKDGEGLWAYIYMHNWFHKTTDLGMTNRRIEIMKPERCKAEWEVAGAVERWEEKYRRIKEEDGEE